MKLILPLFFICLILSCQDNSIPMLDVSGNYLGQEEPDSISKLFAPGIITEGYTTRDFAITPDGNEIYYTVEIGNYKVTTILFTKQIEGKWTKPEIAPFAQNANWKHLEPFISFDGNKFFFVSDRPINKREGSREDTDIWFMERINNSWSEPYNIGAPINSDGSEFYPTLTKSGTIYFTRQPKDEQQNYIMRAKLINGKYQEPEMLGPEINGGRARFNAFIDPDEKYIIVPMFGMEDSFGGTDYYISFRSDEDKWSKPINLGNKVNSPSGLEYTPYVTRDKRFLFFLSMKSQPDEIGELNYSRLVKLYNQPGNVNPAIYWIRADFIHKLKPEWY